MMDVAVICVCGVHQEHALVWSRMREWVVVKGGAVSGGGGERRETSIQEA